MKLGCCVNMLGNAEDEIGWRWLPTLKDAGYDYVELPLAQMMDLSEERFRELVAQTRQLELPCECCNNFFPESVRLTGPAVDAARVQDYVRRALERASRLGVRAIVFGSSGAKNVPQGFPYDRAFDQIVELLQMVSAEAEGIDIVIEPLNRWESNMICTLEEGERLMRRVARDNVALLADYYHFALEEEPLSALTRRAGILRHVHFADPKEREIPEKPRREYEAFFSALHEGGYGARVSVEGYAQEPETALRRAVFLRQYWNWG